MGCKNNYYHINALSKNGFKNAFLNVDGSGAITQKLKFTASLNMIKTFPYITVTLRSANKDITITVIRPDTQQAVTGLGWSRQNRINSAAGAPCVDVVKYQISN